MADVKGISGGTLLVAVGAGAAIYALQTMHVGTLRQMGPGMFPVVTGVVLALLGTAIVTLSSLSGETSATRLNYGAIFCTLGSIAVFAAMIRPFGLIPAILAQVTIASRSSRDATVLGSIVLAMSLAVLAYLIFRIGLGLPLRPFVNPWQ